MYRTSTPQGAGPRKSFAARTALAVALAGGLVLGGAALSVPAQAKDKTEAPKAESNSKAFADAYAPLKVLIDNPAGDFAAAKAMVPAVQATVQNNADKNVFGTALITLGAKLKDKDLEKQGIQLVLDSGKANPSQLGLFHYFLGQSAYEAKNFDEARSQFLAAIQAGYTQEDPRPAIAETYFGSNQIAEGLKYLSDIIKSDEAAGRKAPNAWLLRGLQMAYKGRLAPQATEYSTMLVRDYPSQQSWINSLQVIRAINAFDSDSQLDLLRLMRVTGALKERGDYAKYVDAADPRRMAGEVLAVLDEGVKAGVFPAGDPAFTQAKATAVARAADDRKDAPALVADAKGAANGTIAQGAGDALYSLGDYAQAAQMYQLALDKGVKDRDMILTRLAIAQINQGQSAQAKATLQQVSGVRAPIAAMWLAYIDSKGAAPAA